VSHEHGHTFVWLCSGVTDLYANAETPPHYILLHPCPWHCGTREVEDFLYTHPAVQDVQVVGVPSDKFGEEVCACIILKPGHKATVEEVGCPRG
jgi:hypothetical protein